MSNHQKWQYTSCGRSSKALQLWIHKESSRSEGPCLAVLPFSAKDNRLFVSPGDLWSHNLRIVNVCSSKQSALTCVVASWNSEVSPAKHTHTHVCVCIYIYVKSMQTSYIQFSPVLSTTCKHLVLPFVFFQRRWRRSVTGTSKEHRPYH